MPSVSKSIPEIVQELWRLLKAYARQETVDPLKSLGRYLGFGIGGALLLVVGVLFLALSALRAMQTETSLFDGFWSWAPYFIVAVVIIAIVALAITRITKAPSAASPARRQ